MRVYLNNSRFIAALKVTPYLDLFVALHHLFKAYSAHFFEVS